MDSLRPEHFDMIWRVEREELDPTGMPYPEGTPLAVKLVEWASWGMFMVEQGYLPDITGG